MTGDGLELAPTITRPGAMTLADLRALGLDPNDGLTRAMVWLCREYGLDPLFGHVIVLPSKGGKATPYLTHDGMVQLAHNSGDLDGIEVVTEWETDNGYGATVRVWSKRCAHPFQFNGGCGKGEPQGKRGFGAAMAVTRATRRALVRAFPVLSALDSDDTDDTPAVVRDVVAPPRQEVAPAATGSASTPVAGGVDPAPDLAPGVKQGPAHAIVAGWGRDDQETFLAGWGIDTFGAPWPADAVDAVLAGTALADLTDPDPDPPAPDEDASEVSP